MMDFSPQFQLTTKTAINIARNVETCIPVCMRGYNHRSCPDAGRFKVIYGLVLSM
jgi:hypothetical protein